MHLITVRYNFVVSFKSSFLPCRSVTFLVCILGIILLIVLFYIIYIYHN